jgi:hypothetical protein
MPPLRRRIAAKMRLLQVQAADYCKQWPPLLLGCSTASAVVKMLALYVLFAYAQHRCMQFACPQAAG